MSKAETAALLLRLRLLVTDLAQNSDTPRTEHRPPISSTPCEEVDAWTASPTASREGAVFSHSFQWAAKMIDENYDRYSRSERKAAWAQVCSRRDRARN